MAAIQQAALKPVKSRRPSDTFKIKAGQMLTFDQLSHQEFPEVAERHIVRKAVRKNINRFFGCLALPLTLGYFFFYSVAARLHEDITHVFLMESEFRQRLDASLEDVDTIPQLWNYFQGDFLTLFFPDTDEFGDPVQNMGTKGDKWGNWGRVLTYNQMQGVVIFQQSRNDPLASFGKSSPCCATGATCSNTLNFLTDTKEGFLKNADVIQQNIANFNTAPSCRRLKADASLGFEDEPLDGAAEDAFMEDTHDEQLDRTPEFAVAEARRLKYLHPTLRTSLPKKTKATGDLYQFYLYPMQSKAVALERLQFFQNRQFLDKETKWLEVILYVANADMGRARLVEVKIQFAFALSGGIYYYLDLQTVMLKMFPGMLSMACDFIWFILLIITSMVYVKRLWAAFVKGTFLSQALNLIQIWEFFVILAGWACVYGFYQQSKLIKDVNTSLEDLRALRWRSDEYTYLQKSLAMQETVTDVTGQLITIRYLMAQYLLFLMFRFLVSFAVQPRLATVTTTLKAVLPDILHFLIVFIPTFLAYVISGSLIFGRRMRKFATIQASFSTCFRIVMECEYDWDELAREYYWTTALWIWSFIVLIVLILLNMVLAIILDIYNDVRQASLSGEAVWSTVYNYFKRAQLMHFWVPDMILEDYLTHDIQKPMISRQDIKDSFPDIPDKQLDLLYNVCASDMGWEARRFLDKTTSLKMAGSVKITTDSVNSKVTALTSATDPLKAFVNVQTASQAQAKKKMQSDGLFLAAPCSLKGNRNPRVVDPKLVPKELEGIDANSPEWMKELSKSMTEQKKWILYLAYQIENLQWNLQQSHLNKVKGGMDKI
mmetsp:Transcript_1866/g.3307  ORF Transcript_1866/g.3307 Transcript_1866/m.3307 type:complete len:829 (-) Transcript_1866:79-2565(-)